MRIASLGRCEAFSAGGGRPSGLPLSFTGSSSPLKSWWISA